MSQEQRRHLCLILHGKAATRPEVRTAVETVRGDGHRIDVRVTWEAGDSALYAKEAAAQGVDTVVAGGGDGSLNEVVSGIVDGSGPPACSIASMNPLGQLAPSGTIPEAPQGVPAPYAVLLELDDESVIPDQIPGGVAGTAAIYTESVQATHVIRKIMLRMEAWMNYINPA